MAKRRISQKTISEIGITRINRLLDLSVEAVRQGRNDRARRYVGLARRIGMKTRTTMPKDRSYCKECLLPMVPGVNCTIRLTGHRVSMRCMECGTVKRTPYLKEQRT